MLPDMLGSFKVAPAMVGKLAVMQGGMYQR